MSEDDEPAVAAASISQASSLGNRHSTPSPLPEVTPLGARTVAREARKESIDTAVVLSRLLAIFFQDRLQPLDLDYISESVCRSLLHEQHDVRLLLETAIEKQDYEPLWACESLQFRNVDLRSRRPQSIGDHDIDYHISKFVATYRNIFSKYAQDDEEYPYWVPDDSLHTDDDQVPPSYREFLLSLRLPQDGNGSPSLLLHDLGKLAPISLPSRLQNIFRPRQHTLLMNATGTGKTRLLFEGLSKHWGLYFTCSINDTRLGSLDMDTELCTSHFSQQHASKSHTETSALNVEVTRQLSERVLLVRLTAFNLYLDILPNVCDEHHRRRWLILQLSPEFTVNDDIFFTLRGSLKTCHISPEYVRQQIADTLLKIRSKLGRDEPIFCVLDDAQLASRHYAGAFGKTSALREMARVWEGFEGLTLIMAGTPYNTIPFDLSKSRQYRLCTDTGSFGDLDDHAAYVRRYVPPSLANSDSGEKLVKRVCLWLRGRYCITSTFINCMLATRFSSPHTLLNAYIAKYARFEPADGPVRMSRIRRHYHDNVIYSLGLYDAYAKLLQDNQAWVTMQMVIQRMTTLRQESVKISDDCFRLVTLGFAIFSDADGTEVTIDEPLHVFSALDALFRPRVTASSLFCTRAVSNLEASPAHPFLHLALIPLILLAMKSSPRLCDLFMFAEPRPAWAMQTCRLVYMTRGSDAKPTALPQATAYDTSFPKGGWQDSWATESPEWLNHTVSEPFCVASKFSHADLLWTIQLEDSTLVHVAFSAMFKNKHVDVSDEDVEDKLAQLVPERIFEVPTPPAAGAQSQFFALPTPVADAGSPPVIRVFATYPNVTDVNVLRRDASPQPRAALNMEVLEGLANDDLPFRSIIQRVFWASIIPRKRRLVGDGPGLRVAAEE